MTHSSSIAKHASRNTSVCRLASSRVLVSIDDVIDAMFAHFAFEKCIRTRSIVALPARRKCLRGKGILRCRDYNSGCE